MPSPPFTSADSRKELPGALRCGTRVLRAAYFVPAMIVLLFAPLSPAADIPDWGPRQEATPESISHDLELVLRARKALLEDHALSKVGVGISVRNRTATLWGTVPSKEIAQRAEERVRNVLGIAGIQNRLRMKQRDVSDEDPLAQPTWKPRQRLSEPFIAETRPPQGTLVRRPSQQGLTPSSESAWRPVPGNVEWKPYGASSSENPAIQNHLPSLPRLQPPIFSPAGK